ncbi:MAG TPA: hypothetical protein VGJ55_08330 [Pyrinomonadaceae bacterium]|jgi:hypothetical protein
MRKTALLVILAGLMFAAPGVANGQKRPSKEDIEKVEKAIKDVQKALEGGDADKIKEAKDKAIKLADEVYKIPSDNLAGDPYYDPDVDCEGKTRRDEKDPTKARTRLGEKAFFSPPDYKDPSPGWLASTKIHEILVHAAQAHDKRWPTTGKERIIAEIEGFDKEIENAGDGTAENPGVTGLSKKEIELLKKERDRLRGLLNEANQKKVDKKDYSFAFAEPSRRSESALAGKAQVFVSGEVYAAEVATTTIRGPRTLEGYVVTTEVTGQTAQAKTDERGASMLSLPESAARLTSPTVAIVRLLDPSGKEVARTQTRVLPGPAPDIVSHPVINDIPADIRRGDVITIPGGSLGPQCEMIVGNQVQETLAASANEVTAYVDTPQLGSQDAWVRNPYGESKSFETNVYSFEVSAPRTTIRRGEEVTATAQYQSVRPGSEIHFKNNTPEVVTMNVAGARTMGNEAVISAKNQNGTIPVNLKGLNTGAFSISYEVLSPRGNPECFYATCDCTGEVVNYSCSECKTFVTAGKASWRANNTSPCIPLAKCPDAKPCPLK